MRWDHLILWFGTISSGEVGPPDLLEVEDLLLLVRWNHLILSFGTILSGEVGPFDLVVRDHFIGERKPLDLIVRGHFIW